jgi:hypothetical protein
MVIAHSYLEKDHMNVERQMNMLEQQIRYVSAGITKVQRVRGSALYH